MQASQKTIYGFPPIATQTATILILGSMPGQVSLATNQYYAHAQNVFWRIMAELLQFNLSNSYPAKINALKMAGIALWDVLQSCQRSGSLDTKIKPETQIPNDFSTFLQHHKSITHIFFNGTKAETYFKKNILSQLHSTSFQLTRLPSTSPAHASLSFEEKLTIWKLALSITPTIPK